MRTGQAERVAWLADLQKVRVSDCMEFWEVSAKTVKRDIAYLRAQGVPFFWDAGAGLYIKGEKMTEQQRQQRREALTVSGGVCEVCGAPLGPMRQAAHRIGNTQVNRAKYGSAVVDDVLNVGYVCSLSCNASLDISKKPGECEALALRIYLKRAAQYSQD